MFGWFGIWYLNFRKKEEEESRARKKLEKVITPEPYPEEPKKQECDHLLLPGNGTCIRCGK